MLAAGLLAILPFLPPALDHSPVVRAVTALGVPYRFGGTTTAGFDCGGFVRYAFAASGIRLPRTAALQFTAGRPVDRDELRPGDLVFFRNTYRRGISHVGLYLGNSRFVHAASSRRQVVIDSLDSAYFASRYAGARRYLLGPQ